MDTERYVERFNLDELYDVTLPLCSTYALMGWECARRRFKNSLRNNVQIQGMSSYGARMYYWESFIGAYGDGWMKKECKITIEKLLNFNSVMESCDVYERASALKNMCIGDIEKTLFPDYAKKEKLSTIKFTNSKWYSIDSFKDMDECSLVIDKIIK